MKKIDSGQAIRILANVGVIAGIIFLAVEIQQNSESLAIQARLDREDIIREALVRRFQSPEMLSATVKSQRGDALSDEEALILDWENHSVFIDWMLIYMQVNDGMLDEEAIPIPLWRSAFHEIYPRMADSWSANKQMYRSEFVQWMEQNVVNR